MSSIVIFGRLLLYFVPKSELSYLGFHSKKTLGTFVLIYPLPDNFDMRKGEGVEGSRSRGFEGSWVEGSRVEGSRVAEGPRVRGSRDVEGSRVRGSRIAKGSRGCLVSKY